MHQDIEKLLNAAKEKGSITEKQRSLIIAKAQQLNEDMTEIEFVLDDIPIKTINEIQTPPLVPMPVNPNSNKQGDVRKCPVCGAIVQSYMAVCPECKYTFENVAANKTMTKLMDLLKEIISDNTGNDSKAILRKQKSVIENFPIPNTKADIIEFIVALEPKAINTGDALSKSYFIKYQECIKKAELLFPDDPDIKVFVDNYNKIGKQSRVASRIADYKEWRDRRHEEKIVDAASESKTSKALKYGCLIPAIIILIIEIICFLDAWLFDL